MTRKRIIAIFLIVGFLILGVVWGWRQRELSRIGRIANFEECVKAGNPAMESYPRRCNAKDGQTFIEDIGNELEKANLIRVSSPRPNQAVKSSLTVLGEARGNWFFEASFPIELLDANGKIIAQGIAEAQDEWMTENFVPFRVTLEFSSPLTPTGELILKKDNPSGLPEHDDQLQIPIKFSDWREPSQTTKGVLIGQVSVGPLCPVEPCSGPISPGVYTSRTVIIYRADGRTEVVRTALDGAGHYRFELAPGTYIVNTPQGIGQSSKDLPKQVLIRAGETTVLNFSVDTGIR